MGKTYRECPACGKHALSIATRCPGCGHELLSQPVRRQAPQQTARFQPLAVVVSIVAGVGLVALLVLRGGSRSPEVTASVELPAEAPIAVDTAHAAASLVLPVVADSAPSAEAVARVARTWTKVHARRSVQGDLVAVLLPGDTVLADSLRGGWWRVALEGRVLGYVSAPTLLGD
jgi:DNA-directed RNA polymerase subunit RPC12/RpoP